MANSLTAAAKVIRAELKDMGIKARVNCRNACGEDFINIDNVKYGEFFTSDEQVDIAVCVKAMGFTFIREIEIDCNEGTYGPGFQGLYRKAV